MHLVYLALDKRSIPQTLPTELQRSARKSSNDNGFVANFPTDIAPPPPVPPLPAVLSNIPPAIPPMPLLANRQNSVPSGRFNILSNSNFHQMLFKIQIQLNL